MISTKEEFSVLLMLYTANIDGITCKEELEQIIEKTNPITYKRIKKIISKMSDIEIMDFIQEYKNRFVTNNEEKKEILNQLHSVITSDSSVSPIEEYFQHLVERILEK